jgi:hypothetical protein
VKANAGFDRLQEMRNNSPTGGALGQVSEREIAFLQSTIGNLEQSQSADQLRQNLNRVWNAYQEVINGPGNFERRPLDYKPWQSKEARFVQEGQTATNPQTGQKIIFRGGQWQAVQ